MNGAIDTLRLVVTWQCNLACPYCCNRRQDVQSRVRVVSLGEIEWTRYSTVCITGGEPLLADPKLLKKVLRRAAWSGRTVLYTNGVVLDRDMAWWLKSLGLAYINVGLHGGKPPLEQIRAVEWAVRRLGLHVRYQIQDTELGSLWGLEHSNVNDVFVKPWHDGDCERANEDLVALEPVPDWLRGRS